VTPAAGLKTPINGIYAGRARTITADGAQSAIRKSLVEGPVRISTMGVAGDQQADPDVHGGADKAVHQFAAANYAVLAQAFPQATTALTPGSIGENLSSALFDQNSVCVGDIFTVGAAVLQVSQPRSPCWKIDARFGVDGMSRFVSEHALAGWYYRVIQEGTVVAGDMLTLRERNADPITLREFWTAWISKKPDVAELERLRGIPGLAAGWLATLEARIEKLRGKATSAVSPVHARKPGR
jgi:MOSC domain-containing protein YiiM